MTFTKEDLIQDLKNLGLMEGDVCVVRAALRAIGPVTGKRSKVMLDALLDAVGTRGTIITLSFTNIYSLPIESDDPKYIYTQDTIPYSGGLAIECVRHPNAVRSKHPATSFCAIGQHAHFLLDEHNEKSPSYLPIGKTIEKNGKLLLIGCIDSSPGFTTVHWAQWLLGLATRTKKKGTLGVYYYSENGQKKLFVRKDFGGCSMGFHKFYDYYRRAGVLKEGKVGDAQSMLVDAERALSIEIPLIKKDPCFLLCDDPTCRTCRIGWEYSDTSPLRFWLNLKTISKGLKRAIKHS